MINWTQPAYNHKTVQMKHPHIKKGMLIPGSTFNLPIQLLTVERKEFDGSSWRYRFAEWPNEVVTTEKELPCVV